ncbi:unnamed protein product [Ectocarpus sp. 12 AP-2014]
MSELVTDADAQQQGKRVMTPAIETMTVKEERACLSEIRKLGAEVDHQHILSNGWTTGKFALMYVTGQHVKRKIKAKKTERAFKKS